MLNGVSHHIRRLTIAACIASLAFLAFSTTASASPDRGRVIISGGVHVDNDDHGRGYGPGYGRGYPRQVVHGDRCGCGDCCAKRDYARGVSRGEAAGSNQGFRDGINCKPFCADVRDDLRCESRAFIDGYGAAFGNSYRCAFEQGRAQRAAACKPQPYRPRCPW